MSADQPAARTNGVVVIGTDFGVGKTLVARALIFLLARRGQRVSAMKPVEVGCALSTNVSVEINGMPGPLDEVQRRALERLGEVAGPPPALDLAHATPEALVPADANVLRHACGRDLDIDLVCPYRYAPAVVPAAAARVADRPIELDRIISCFDRLASDADFVVVEGVGGLLVPLSADTLAIDLFERLGLPVLLVAPSRQGATNHCLLCIEALRSRGIPLGGVVLNRLDDSPPRPEEAATPLLIETFAGSVVLGMLPHLPADKLSDVDFLAGRLHAHVDLGFLLHT